jgi:Probable lipoprotein LpqN
LISIISVELRTDQGSIPALVAAVERSLQSARSVSLLWRGAAEGTDTKMCKTSKWRVLAGSALVSAVAIIAGPGGSAAAEPVYPPRPTPAPATANQPFAVAPGTVANSTIGVGPALAPAPAAAAARPQPAAAAPATSGTIRDYLQSNGVALEPQKSDDFTALDITLPMPPRWSRVPDPNVVDPFVVIADRSGTSLYTSNAQVVVYKLIGDFDPRAAISHGFVGSQQLMAWKTVGQSLADFGGFPSSIIKGTYRQNNMTLATVHRHVIATSGPDRYLVSLAVTTGAGQAAAERPGTEAIVNGFRVAAPGSAPRTAPPAPAAPASLPAVVPGTGPTISAG